ncbi:hypothetical protein C0989_000671 [Termitomyces sp. Mn162]|nr:hypothetical protein C0989_000671 [Termitomyces sp. Mn162]
MSTASTSTVVQGNSAPPPDETSSLRSKVIEILAGTANGCLTELGYHPGMPQRLQELERQNAQWQSENVKLFQDNQALNRALQERKSSQPDKTISALQTQIQVLRQEKSILMKQNHSLLAGQPVAYRNLLMEYTQFQEYYHRALQEIRTLRHNNALLSGRTPIQSPVTPGPAVLNLPIFGTHGAPPQVQKSPSSASPFPVPQNPHINSKQPTISVSGQQTPTIRNTQQIHPSASQAILHHLDPEKDINLPSSISRVSRSRPTSRPASSMSLSRPSPLPLPVITTAAALVKTENINQHDMTSYPPGPMSAPPTSQRHPFHSPVVEAPNSQKTCPLASNSTIPLRKYSLPSTLSCPTESFVFLPTPSALLQTSQTNPPTTQTIDGTVTPKDIMNDLPLSADVNSNEEQKPLPGSINALANHAHESVSPATPFEVVTPMNPTIDNPSSVTIVSTPPIESLKRPSLEELPIPKKPRLEEENNADRSVEPDVETVESPVNSVREENSENSEDEEIQVGPDGLRLVEDCLPALIEDDEENAEMKTCKLCTARFKLGYAAEPKPFVNATTEELVQHCISEHQSAWERLRNTV